MNNVQKAFKTKSKLRCMADGGQVDPNILGSGMAQRAGAALQGRRAQLDAAIDAASNGDPPPQRPAPTPATAAPAKKPEEKSALRSFFGLADGGQVFKNTVGGVPTFTDAKAATAGAKAYTPGQGGGTFSVVGMEPEQKQQMADAAAQRQAAANAPTTLGGRLDAALGKLNSPLATAGAPSSTPTLGSQLDAAIGRTQGVSSPQVPATGAPANDVNRIMNSRDMSTFSPREKASFSSMSSNANAMAAQNADLGLSALRTPSIPTDTVLPSQLQQDYQDFFGLADGGKVKGKGGPTDDEVGPVMLSHGEYVLPADTVDIVGRDKLDALRLATHDFVDPKNKPKTSGLRKMADGGTFYVDPEGVASRQMPPGRAIVPYQPPITTTTPRALAPSVTAGAPSKLGGAARTGGALLGAGLEAKNVYDAYQSGGVDAAVPEAAMGATRLASARLGAGIGASLPLPGWGKPIAAAVGGVAGYAAPNAIGNSDFAKEVERKNALRNAFSSRIDGELAPEFNPRANTITTSDGRMFGSGRLESNPHLQYQGYLSAKTDRAIDSKAPLFNPTVAEMEAIGALRPRNSNPSTDPKFNPTVADLERDGALRPAVPMDSAMRALRSGKEPGGGFTQTNVPGIFGRKSSDPKNDLGEYIGVGKPDPQEDPIMGEIRSALRGLTDGAGNRGGGGGGASIGRGNASDINARYDRLAKQLSGMYSPKGQGNLARRLLELEQSRWGALDADARNQSALRGQDMQAATSAANANASMLQTLGTMANQRSQQDAQAQAALLRALQDAQKAGEGRMEDNAKVFESVADTFAEGDKGKASQYRELLATLPPELHQIAQGLAPEDKRAFYTNIVRQQLGRNDGLVLGRDTGATVQNAVIGGLLGRMARFGGGAGGKAVDLAIGKIPRVGPLLSALRPAENLSRFSTLIGAAGGAYATPEVENLTRWDPVARDPVSGAALPARQDVREAATYGAFDTYLNPFEDSVQTVSGRRTDRPTPDEEEAARRFRSALRN